KAEGIKFKNVEREQLTPDKEADLWAMVCYPQYHSTRWDGDVALIRSSKRQLRIDTKKLEATLEAVKEEQTADQKTIQHAFTFGKDGPTVRVVELERRNYNPEKGEELNIGQFRVELLKPGETKPKILVDKFDGVVQMLTSPNNKLLA